MADVILTHDEAESLMYHLEGTILDEIRNDEDYDNLGYLANLMSIYAKCKIETESKKTPDAIPNPLSDVASTVAKTLIPDGPIHIEQRG